MKHPPISKRENLISGSMVRAALEVHRTLGPGLLEYVYELCFCHELTKGGLAVRRQVVVPIVYQGVVFRHALRLDVLVEDLVICELKSVEVMNPVFPAQVLTQLKLTGKRLGFLIKFNVPLIKHGIRRIAL